MKSYSESLTEVLKFLESVTSEYEYNYSLVNEKDKEHQDHIHKLELDGLKYRERAKLATKMQINRIERRKSKDIVSVLEPLYLLPKDDTHKKTINKLKQALGEIRKREEKLKTRTYHKRIKQ